MKKFHFLYLCCLLITLCLLGSCSNDNYDSDDENQTLLTDKEQLGLLADVKTATFTTYINSEISDNNLIKGTAIRTQTYEFNKMGMATQITDYDFQYAGDKVILIKTYEMQYEFDNNNSMTALTFIKYSNDSPQKIVNIDYYAFKYDKKTKEQTRYHYTGNSKETLQPISKTIWKDNYSNSFDYNPIKANAAIARKIEWQKDLKQTEKKVIEKDAKGNIILHYNSIKNHYESSYYESIPDLETIDITYYDGTKSEKKGTEELTEKATFVAIRQDSSYNGRLKSKIAKTYYNSVWDEENKKLVPGDRYDETIEKYSEMGYLIESNSEIYNVLYEVDSKGRITKQTEISTYQSPTFVVEKAIEYTDKEAIELEKKYYIGSETGNIVEENKKVYSLTKDGFANSYNSQSYHPIPTSSSRMIAKDSDFEEKPSANYFLKIEKDKFENTTTYALIYQDIDTNGKVLKSKVNAHFQTEYQYY